MYTPEESLNVLLPRYQRIKENFIQRKRSYADDCEVNDYSYVDKFRDEIEAVDAKINEIQDIKLRIQTEITRVSKELESKKKEYAAIKESGDDDPELYIELREIQSAITALLWV